MNISTRTFSDSGNHFLHSLGKCSHPLETLLTRQLYTPGTFDFCLLLHCLRRLPHGKSLHSIGILHQKCFARSHASVGGRLYAHHDLMRSTVAFVSRRVIAENILLREVDLIKS